ncbi:MAG: FtsX-like permease family protein [Acidobacteria bacterium]|nr:FtsX-like permease family protein [Acidobacteriota bacterium]
MSAYRQKVIRDFWQERTRTVFVVLAIAIGISAFSAVLSSYAILTRELDQGYLETNPASATLRTDKLDDELVAAIAASKGVSDAEARRTLTGRMKVGPVEWRNLTLFVVKDFGDIRVSTLTPQQGAWPPAPGEILIERDAVQVAKARIGDSVTIKTARGNERTLRFSGSVKDVGQAQARMENAVYGYVNLDTLAQLGEEPYLDQLKLVVAGNKFDEVHVRSITADVQKLIESRGHPVRRVDIPEPGKHPHSNVMGLLLLAMSSFGLFALLLSGILVVNLLMALMAAQIRQIGVMKTLGGTRRQIAGIYFGQALLLGIAAFLVAMPVGLWGSRVLCRYFAVLLNFDITSFAVPLWVYLLVAAVGLVVPLLAAAYPVWKGSGVSVREALDDYGVGQKAFGTSAFDRALTGLGGAYRPVLLALRNSFRRRMRLALTMVTLVLAGLFFMAALNVRASLINTIDHLFDTMKYDLTVNLGGMYPFEKVERATRNTPGVLQAEGWLTTEGSLPRAGDAPANSGGGHMRGGGGNMHDGGGQGGSGVGHGGGAAGGARFSVVGVPVETNLLKPNMLAGRSLQPGDTNAIVVNTRLASFLPQINIGEEVKLQIGPAQSAWRVVGVAREPFAGPVAYIPRSFFESAGHVGMTNSIRLALDKTDSASINSVKANLDRNLEQEGTPAQSSSSKADSRFSVDQHMVMIYIFLIVMSGILAGVGGLGLMTTMNLNVLERRREMGVLRAIGAAPSVVWLIVITEGVVIGVLSWALATLAAWPVSKAIGDSLVKLMFKVGLDFFFEPSGPLIWLGVSICLGTVASFLPAWHASRRPVREAIGYE